MIYMLTVNRTETVTVNRNCSTCDLSPAHSCSIWILNTETYRQFTAHCYSLRHVFDWANVCICKCRCSKFSN